MMSILSKLDLKKNGASTKPDQTAAKPEPTPYRHVPTHAASDALSQAPPGASADADKIAIREQRKQRGEISRQNSSLSTVTTVDRSSGSASDGWTTTTVDQRKILPVFQNITVSAPKKPRVEGIQEISPDFGSDKLSSTASSSGSSFLEIPSCNIRPSKRLLASTHPRPITQIPEHHAVIEAAHVKTLEAAVPAQARKPKKPRTDHYQTPPPHPAPNRPPPIPPIPGRLSTVLTNFPKPITTPTTRPAAPNRSVIDFSRPRSRFETDGIPAARAEGYTPKWTSGIQAQGFFSHRRETSDASSQGSQYAENWPFVGPESQAPGYTEEHPGTES